jgi:hypothetical protein
MPASAGDYEGAKMKKISINWNGIPLDCEYEYTPAERGTRIDPPIPEQWEVIEARTFTGFDLVNEHPGTQDSILAEIIEQLESQSMGTRHGRRRV